jgi:hypothetical protein
MKFNLDRNGTSKQSFKSFIINYSKKVNYNKLKF